MCAPALIPLAIAVVGAISTNRDQKAQYATNKIVAEHDLALNTEALDAQRGEIKARAADEMSERARQALIERGRLRAIAAESGLTGISQQRLENESRFLEGQDLAAIETNRASALRQNTRNLRAAELDAERTKLGLSSPSLLGAGLQIAGAGAKAYAATKKKPATTSSNFSGADVNGVGDSPY